MLFCLPAHLVVRNPPVLRYRFAVGGQFGFVVDGGAGVVVFHPAGVPQVWAHVNVVAQPNVQQSCKEYL